MLKRPMTIPPLVDLNGDLDGECSPPPLPGIHESVTPGKSGKKKMKRPISAEGGAKRDSDSDLEDEALNRSKSGE